MRGPDCLDKGRASQHAVDKSLPIEDMKTPREQFAESLYLERIIAALSVMFGICAALLAATVRH